MHFHSLYIMIYLYTKFKENPYVGTDVSTPLTKCSVFIEKAVCYGFLRKSLRMPVGWKMQNVTFSIFNKNSNLFLLTSKDNKHVMCLRNTFSPFQYSLKTRL